MSANFETLKLADWRVRIRDATGSSAPQVALLLHGLTGDEHVMEIFGSRLPSSLLLIAPRAPFQAKAGGFSWLEEEQGANPPAAAFSRGIQLVLDMLDLARYDLSGDFRRLHVLGFSQGAALSYLFALQHPARVLSVAGLAGFFPQGADQWIASNPLTDVPAFVSHGIRDETIPIERGRASVLALQQAGAAVTYCEADVGHKLGADCFRALAHFYDSLDGVSGGKPSS